MKLDITMMLLIGGLLVAGWYFIMGPGASALSWLRKPGDEELKAAGAQGIGYMSNNYGLTFTPDNKAAYVRHY